MVPVADEAMYFLEGWISPFIDKYLTTNMEQVVHCL